MAKQTLDLRRDEPIVIETPEGLIRISKLASHQNRGKILIELPGGMKAFVGEERALDHARFVTKTSDGRLVPTYSVLVPTKGDDGSLAGVKAQQPMRIVGSAEAAPAVYRMA